MFDRKPYIRSSILQKIILICTEKKRLHTINPFKIGMILIVNVVSTFHPEGDVNTARISYLPTWVMLCKQHYYIKTELKAVQVKHMFVICSQISYKLHQYAKSVLRIYKSVIIAYLFVGSPQSNSSAFIAIMESQYKGPS